MSDKKEALAVLMDKINRKHKKKVVAFASEVASPYFTRRPSGIMQLDVDTAGGLPAGGLSFLSGPEGSGKTYLLYKYFAWQQKLYGNNCAIAFCPTEHKPDYFFMRKIGVKVEIPDESIEERSDMRKQRGMPRFTKAEVKAFKEQVGSFTLFSGANGEETCDIMVTLLRSNLYNILAIDSLSGLMPKTEADTENKDGFEQNPQQAAEARLLTRFIQHYYSIAAGLENPHHTTTIFTNQVRSNRKKTEAASFMQKYIKEWAPMGGWAAKHAKLIDICVWGGEKINKGEGANKEQIGKELEWELIKGKSGTHEGIRGSTPYLFASGVDETNGILAVAAQKGFITKGSQKNTFCWADPATGEKLPSLADDFTIEGLKDRLEADLDFNIDLRYTLLYAHGIECRYQ